MARKLNSEEREDFAQLLKEAELSGHRETDTLSTALTEKSKASLKLSPELAFWFGDDVPGLPVS
jgi:hypothetical protein